MKVAILTANQPRHLSLIRAIAGVTEKVTAVIETTSIHPWDNHPKSAVLKGYFQELVAAERRIFGEIFPLSSNISTLPLKAGDLNRLSMQSLKEVLDSDLILSFGSSLIKSPLIEHLVEKRALNLHLGTSPYFRGTACNFWALFDKRPDLVGATIHYLTEGVDAGPILFHAVPPAIDTDGFTLGMLTARAAQRALVHHISAGNLLNMVGINQNSSLEIRYSRSVDFNEEIATTYLNDPLSNEQIGAMSRTRNLKDFINPFVDVY